MRVGELVAKLATMIWQSGRPLSPTQRHMCQALRMLPEFVELRRVDLLEIAFPPAIDADDPQLNRLLEAIYELGRYNLYTQFNRDGTLREYGAVAWTMREQGFDPPSVDAITDWQLAMRPPDNPSTALDRPGGMVLVIRTLVGAGPASECQSVMPAEEPSFIWVFNGGSQFPGGVFTTVEKAEAWIAHHGLSGVLTKYPVDEGCFDWAIRTGHHGLSEKKLVEKREDKRFIGGFSSAAQDHIHYEAGKRA